MATTVKIMKDKEKKRVARPSTNAKAPIISKYVAMPQLISGCKRLKGNGKVISAKQLLPCSFSKKLGQIPMPK